MTNRLAFVAIVSALSFASGAAHADAVMVVGTGPERACYYTARIGKDLLGGLSHCNAGLNSALILRDRAATLINRGVILHKLNRFDQALDDFNAALRIVPDQADGFINRGVAKISLQQYDDALADIQKGIDLVPTEMAVAYYNRAIAYERLQRLREAYLDYQRALKEEPNFKAASDALSRFVVVVKPRG